MDLFKVLKYRTLFVEESPGRMNAFFRHNRIHQPAGGFFLAGFEGNGAQLDEMEIFEIKGDPQRWDKADRARDPGGKPAL